MKHFAVFAAAPVVILCASICAQQEKTAFSDLAVLAPKLIHLQDQFEHQVPPGVSIEAKEVLRKGESGKDLQVRYYIYVKGVAPDTMFRQIQWPVDREKPMGGVNGITLNSDGMMICAGRTPEQCHNGDKLDAPMLFALQTPLKGEPRRFIFISQNLRIPFFIVPDPVQSEDKGCKLNAIRLSAKFELALIEGSGFPPNSDLRLRTSDGGIRGTIFKIDDKGVAPTTDTSAGVEVKTDSKGAFQTTILNNTDKNPKGRETVEILATQCSPKISYEWGVF